MNLCKIGLHRWTPVKTFDTQIRDDCDRTLGYMESWRGYVCKNPLCEKRKIKQIGRVSAPGTTQRAFDWLNDKPQ